MTIQKKQTAIADTQREGRVLVQVWLSAAEAGAVKDYAVRHGLKVASLTRSLLVRAAMGEVIDAWARSDEDRDISETSTVQYKLEPVEPIKARELVVRVYERYRDISLRDSYVGPCSMASLSHCAFVNLPKKHVLQLRGGGRWRVAGHFDVTPLDGSKPYTKLFLERT